MKLTAKRLKKLIREELEKINESSSEEEKKELFIIMQKSAEKNGYPEPKRSKIAETASKEIFNYLFKFTGAYVGDDKNASMQINTSKYSSRFPDRQPSNPEETIFQIIINSASAHKSPESKGESLAKIAIPAILKSKAYDEYVNKEQVPTKEK